MGADEQRRSLGAHGLYFYDNRVVEFARTLQRLSRGEYEIADINRLYVEQGALFVEQMGRGYAWLDTGAHSLLEANEYVGTIEHRQGIQIACLEEISYPQGMSPATKPRPAASSLPRPPTAARSSRRCAVKMRCLIALSIRMRSSASDRDDCHGVRQ